MPRKGPIEFSVVPTKIRPFERPEPPSEFTPAEAEVWKGVMISTRMFISARYAQARPPRL